MSYAEEQSFKAQWDFASRVEDALEAKWKGGKAEKAVCGKTASGNPKFVLAWRVGAKVVETRLGMQLMSRKGRRYSVATRVAAGTNELAAWKAKPADEAPLSVDDVYEEEKAEEFPSPLAKA